MAPFQIVSAYACDLCSQSDGVKVSFGEPAFVAFSSVQTSDEPISMMHETETGYMIESGIRDLGPASSGLATAAPGHAPGPGDDVTDHVATAWAEHRRAFFKTELVVCESCLTRAGAAIHLGDVAPVEEERDDAFEQRDQAKAESAEFAERNAALEDAMFATATARTAAEAALAAAERRIAELEERARPARRAKAVA